MPQDKTVITPVEIITPQQQEKRNPWRPSKYDPSFIQKVDEYLEMEENRGKRLPTLEGYALYIKVDPDQISRWSKAKLKDASGNKTKDLKYPDFCGAMKKIRAVQKNQLISDGLYGGRDVNSIMAIFLLKVNHGMIETNHTDLTTKGEKVIPLLGGGANVPVNISDK